MHLRGVLAAVTAAPGMRRALARMESGGARVTVVDALHGPLLAAFARDYEGRVLGIAPSLSAARSLVDQLRAWLGDACPIELFAERDSLPYDRVPTDAGTRSDRIRALELLANAPRGIVISSGRALIDRIAEPAAFRERTIAVRRGDRVSPGTVIERLIAAGYRLTGLVEQPGEASRRGDILDVFPFSAAGPARIEFFGDDIDDIRSFDPITQRSAEHIQATLIPPASDLYITPESALADLARIDVSTLDTEFEQSWSHVRAMIESGTLPDSPEILAGYLARATLLDYLASNDRIVAFDWSAIEAAVEAIEHQANESRASAESRGVIPRDLVPPVTTWTDIAVELNRRGRVDVGADDDESSVSSARLNGFHPAQPYGGRLRVFFDDVVAARESGDRVVIISQQDNRLSELLDERRIEHTRGSVGEEEPSPGSVALLHGAAIVGFRLDRSADGGLIVATDGDIFGWTKPRRATRPRSSARDTFVIDLEVDGLVVHVEHGIGRYRGLVHMSRDGVDREYLAIDYADTDKLFVPVEQADRVSKYIGFGDGAASLHRLGGTEWARAKSRVKAAVQEMARELLELYAARQVAPGHAFMPDTSWQAEMEAAFPYVETNDQLTAIQDVKRDMETNRPMDRLLCGDVGYGKTEVALRAAFKAVMDGKQVAVLVPTTVLAQQHFATFRERLQAFPIKIEMLSRFRSDRDQHAVVAGLKAGSVDICIGTHRVVQKDVEFKDLGLAIIDEEQRFGVVHKERLKQLRREVDVLTLTATPIPRTLHMSLAGVRDMSTMEIAPEDRLPIRTSVEPWDDGLIREAILREIDRGGQVFFVHNRVQSIYAMAQRLRKLIPEVTCLIGHGQLPENDLEEVMARFAAGDADVLMCTTIIESGLDIPNANTIIVNDADHFGLAQLYQLRGRVGRGANRAYAYFLYKRDRVLGEIAEKRLKTIHEATELGAGFRIAMKDLEIRGAGNLLGSEQSGHASAVGLQLYTDLLAEAVAELRGTQAEKRPDVSVDLPLEASIPRSYVPDEGTRLALYRRLAKVTRDEELAKCLDDVRDMYGAPPEQFLALVWLVQTKIAAAAAGVEQINATATEFILRFRREQPERLRLLEPAFEPYVRAGRAYLYLDRVGLGGRWQATLDGVLNRLKPAAA
ncbi:MAG: transcription-repair coupling factor [Chloroflexota bacterium]|nr:MAG: transcription-repair coupling factor [Chloroflexota bacterium]